MCTNWNCISAAIPTSTYVVDKIWCKNYPDALVIILLVVMQSDHNWNPLESTEEINGMFELEFYGPVNTVTVMLSRSDKVL